jgi:hypothetical protein
MIILNEWLRGGEEIAPWAGDEIYDVGGYDRLRLNRATQDRYSTARDCCAADSPVGRLLTRAVAVPVSQWCLA